MRLADARASCAEIFASQPGWDSGPATWGRRTPRACQECHGHISFVRHIDLSFHRACNRLSLRCHAGSFLFDPAASLLLLNSPRLSLLFQPHSSLTEFDFNVPALAPSASYRADMSVKDLHTKVTSALASDGSISNCRLLCEVVEHLATGQDEKITDDLGKTFATGLLRFFLNSAHEALLRRWAGILLSELCRLSHRTASLLSHSRNTGSVELEGLGRLVLEHGEREDLQVVSCLIMKQLHAQSIQQDLFWPAQAPAITFAVPDSQELMSHLQDILDSVSGPRRSHTDVLYPDVFGAGEDWYFDNRNARIAALLEHQLTIIVPPPAAHHIIFIDIPFDNIIEVVLEAEAKVRLRLESNFPSCAYTVNATEAYTGKVDLEFGGQKEAAEAMVIIQRRCPQNLPSSQPASLKLLRSSSPYPDRTFDGSKDSEDQEADPTDGGTTTIQGIKSSRLTGKGIKPQPSQRPRAADKEYDRARGPGTLRSASASNGEAPGGHRTAKGNGNESQDPRSTSPDPDKNDGKFQNAHQPPQENAIKPSGDDSNVYDFPVESPSPIIPPENPNKTKGKVEGKGGRPKKKPSGNGRKRKDDRTNEDMDDDYQPRQQRKDARKSSAPVTRGSKAVGKSDIETSDEQKPSEGLVVKQERESLPRTRPKAKETEGSTQVENLGEKSGTGKAGHQRRSQPKPSPKTKSESLHRKGRAAKQKEREASFYEDNGNPAIAYDEDHSSDSDAFEDNRESSLKMPNRQAKAGGTQDNALILSSGEDSDSCSSHDDDDEEDTQNATEEKPVMEVRKEIDRPTTYLMTDTHSKPLAESTNSKSVSRNVKPETNHLDTEVRVSGKAGSTSKIPPVSEANDLKTRKNQPAHNSLARKPQNILVDSRNQQNQGRQPARTTPAPVTPFQPAYSSARHRRRRGPDHFSAMLEHEEATAAIRGSSELKIPRKRSAEDSLPNRSEKRLQKSPVMKIEQPHNRPAPQAEPKLAAEAVNAQTSSPGTFGFLDGFEDDATLGADSSPLPREHQHQMSPKKPFTKLASGMDKPPEAPSPSRPPSHPSNSFRSADPPDRPTAGPTTEFPIERQTEKSYPRTTKLREVKTKLDIDSYPTQVLYTIQHASSSNPTPQIQADSVQTDAESMVGKDLGPPGMPRAHIRMETQTTRPALSSNKKKLPGPPEADSQAITTHVPANALKASTSLQTPARSPIDPFNGITPTSHPSKDETHFLRKLRKDMEKQANPSGIDPDNTKSGSEEGADQEDPDRTLVEMVDEIMGVDLTDDRSTSEDSSTAEESEEFTEEMEWEASLKPHQRDMFDALTRISRHFVRHLIDAETAIEDIISEYDQNGMRLIEQMEESHRKEYESQRKTLTEARTRMSKSFVRISDQLASEEKQARSSLLGKNCEKDAATSRKHISHLGNLLDQMGGK